MSPASSAVKQDRFPLYSIYLTPKLIPALTAAATSFACHGAILRRLKADCGKLNFGSLNATTRLMAGRNIFGVDDGTLAAFGTASVISHLAGLLFHHFFHRFAQFVRCCCLVELDIVERDGRTVCDRVLQFDIMREA